MQNNSNKDWTPVFKIENGLGILLILVHKLKVSVSLLWREVGGDVTLMIWCSGANCNNKPEIVSHHNTNQQRTLQNYKSTKLDMTMIHHTCTR